jgi:hypothetical protein
MPTLLTNSKMDPALAARIEASLGRRTARAKSAIYKARVVALARLVAVTAVLAAGVALYVSGARARDRFERRRATLLDSARAKADGIGPAEQSTRLRAEAAIHALTGAWPGDLVSDALRARGLATALAEPTIYARVGLDELTRGRTLAAATRELGKDALLFCAIDPPTARDEQAVVAKVLAGRDEATLEARTATAVSLRDLELGLPLLDPTFRIRVKVASTNAAMSRLEETLARAPIDAARKGARAGWLLVALDEGGSLGVDGDRPHDVRVALVDLTTGAPALRVRRRVDPSWVSTMRRAKYSVELDGCRLAMDLREATSRAQ